MKLYTSYKGGLPLALVLCLLSVSCTDSLIDPQTGTSQGGFVPVGEQVEVKLNVSVEQFTVEDKTRTEEPTAYNEEDTDEERHIDDLWVFEYDTTTKELIGEPQHVTISDQDELENLQVKVTLRDNDKAPVDIYVVANAGSGVDENSTNWVTTVTSGQGPSATTTYPGFMTVSDLKANTIPTPHPQRMEWDAASESYVLNTQDADAVSIPMTGSKEDVVVRGTIEVPVTRMFAKVLIRLDLTTITARYQSVMFNLIDIRNIPEYSRIEPMGNSETTAEPEGYSNCRNWITRSFNYDADEGNLLDDDIYPYLIYVPENIQGEKQVGSSTVKSDNAPEGKYSGGSTDALSASAGLYVTDNNGVTTGQYPYIGYPGGNNTNNFNVRRNCVYRVTMTINDLIDDILPSANCIVCPSGEITAFWPYCRTETGGGYDFTDYLDADGDDSKKIASVEIIWQRHSENGNYGYIGNNSSNQYVWIDDLADVEDEYYRKIYVSIPDGEIGNALIGAYNSSGTLLWSWHIWSRARANDPTNSNLMLYYTYDWDSSGIYGMDSGRPRVAGYTIMNCNLGALIDEPTSYPSNPMGDYSTEPGNLALTFGTMYQWGRKDPFPPQANTFGSYNCDYVTGYLGSYYDNTGSQQVSMTTGEKTTEGELFYSVPGENRAQDFNTALLNSIQNPTVFYCGTNLADQSSSYNGTSASTSEDVQDILTKNYPYPNDGNWIYDSEGDHFNRLWGGLDPEQDIISKTYNTKLYDLSGNEVHLYDDYGEKSIFDPCPYGWRVSPPDLWLGFTATGLNTSGVLDDGWSEAFSEINYDDERSCYFGFTMYLTGWRTGDTSFFPNQGVRLPSGDLLRAGQCGNYNNATSDANDRVNILHLHYYPYYFRIFELGVLPYYLKSTASPVRCVRETK